MPPQSPPRPEPPASTSPAPPPLGTAPPSPSSAQPGLQRKSSFRRSPCGGGRAMREEVILQRDIELEGKNERIRGLLAEADALRARLRKADAAAAAAAIRAREATAVAAAAVAVTAILLLLLLLLAWAGWPWPVGEWSPSAGPVARAAGPRVVGQAKPSTL